MRTHIHSNVEEHSTYTLPEIADFIGDYSNLAAVSRKLTIMVARIVELTSFIDEAYKDTKHTKMGTTPVPMAMRYLFIKNGFHTKDLIPNCAECKTNKVTFYETAIRGHCTDSLCTKTHRAAKMVKTNLETYGVRSTSSIKEVRAKQKKTSIERYGFECALQNEEVRAKTVQTNLDLYGDEYPQRTEAVKAKVIQTNIQRFGAKTYAESEHARHQSSVKMKLNMSDPEFVEQIKQTNMERYDCENLMMSPDVVIKTKATNMGRYGVTSPKQSHISKEVMDILNDPQQLKKLYDGYGSLQLGKLLGVCDGTITAHLRRHNLEVNPTTQSAVERRLAAFIESHGVDIIQNDRTVLNDKELDIYIPSLKLAFEMNGVYWHSTKFKPSRHLLEKQKACDEAGIRLVHIFDDEYNQREEQFNRKIKRLIGVADGEKRVYARKTEARIIDNKVAKPFYDVNHIQGNGFGSVAYGLYHGDELVACMSFKTNFGYMELTRYATSCNVIGGFTKLVKAFMRDNQDIDRLVSFADCRYSDAGMYEKNGWVQIGKTKPSYWYVINGVRVPKQKFRRKYLPAFLGDGFVEEQSETENMENNGYYRIFDCGLKKFELTRKY